MSRSLVYGVNSINQVLTVNSPISFGNAVRRFGCNCTMSGGNVEIAGTGYYMVNTNVNITAGGASTTLTMYLDGVAIPGATQTLTTTATDDYVFGIPAVIRQKCNCSSTLTMVLTGSAGTVTNASITVEKL